jgi:SAM-dependent methyltransferase
MMRMIHSFFSSYHPSRFTNHQQWTKSFALNSTSGPRAGKGESMERGHRPVGEQAIARMNVLRDARVLDIGCGSGWATRLLADYASAGHVTGIDISMR